MSIGSETNGGVDTVNVCDLTIDNSMRATGSPAVDINGLRIKSDPSRGGAVKNISYSEICIRDVDNPIIFNPFYSGTSGSSVPTYTGISVKNLYATSSSLSQVVTLDGFDSSHITTATLDNVVVNGSSSVNAQDAAVTLGPGAVSFAAAITGTGVTVHNNVSGASTPIDCSNRWVAIP
jgi:polygalacturonase